MLYGMLFEGQIIFIHILIKDYETSYHFIIPGWFFTTWI